MPKRDEVGATMKASVTMRKGHKLADVANGGDAGEAQACDLNAPDVPPKSVVASGSRPYHALHWRRVSSCDTATGAASSRHVDLDLPASRRTSARAKL